MSAWDKIEYPPESVDLGDGGKKPLNFVVGWTDQEGEGAKRKTIVPFPQWFFITDNPPNHDERTSEVEERLVKLYGADSPEIGSWWELDEKRHGRSKIINDGNANRIRHRLVELTIAALENDGDGLVQSPSDELILIDALLDLLDRVAGTLFAVTRNELFEKPDTDVAALLEMEIV